MDDYVPTPFNNSEKQESDQTIIRIIIEGRVQKVGFRNWMLERAKHYKLNGWVRNKSDESVEALLAGPSIAVEEVITQAYHGPPFASVKRIKRFPESSLSNRTKGFSILPTI